MTDADVLIVGSGPSAVHAAEPLVEAGLAVTMLDVGNEDRRYAPLIPDLPFHDLRRTDPRQHRYLLGDDLEALPLGGVRVGAQLTPPRSHVLRDVAVLTPLESTTFAASESLALGGLGAAWGASAVAFDERDLRGLPLTREDLAPHYVGSDGRSAGAVDAEHDRLDAVVLGGLAQVLRHFRAREQHRPEFRNSCPHL